MQQQSDGIFIRIWENIQGEREISLFYLQPSERIKKIDLYKILVLLTKKRV
jgi:hypothetical protein